METAADNLVSTLRMAVEGMAGDEAWVMSVNGHRPQGWRDAVRSALRQVGRTVNPLGWPETPETPP